MDYPLAPTNWICRYLGHRFRAYTDRNGIDRKTCSLDGTTVPPFRKVSQEPGGGYLPDDQQPAGAV
jgi:hypothetical protein